MIRLMCRFERRAPYDVYRGIGRMTALRDLCPLVMLAWLAALQIAVSAVDSAPRPIRQLVHTRWTVKDGAPTDIAAITQTPDGYLWLAARSGLVRFDGVRFVPLAERGADTIPNGGVQRLLAARDSSLWIVWANGVIGRWRDG